LPASANGTLYDLIASGPGFAYAFANNVLAQRSTVKSVQLDAAPAGQIALTGKVTDACSGMPLQGATLQIVAPAPGSGADCNQVPTPSACVVLASANTDDTGSYPMPASNFVLQDFNQVPNGDYTMVVTDAGYDTVASSMAINGGAACSAGTGGQCNFALGRSQIEGLVTISPPVPSPRALNVLVTAEDHGTHHIENVALATVPAGSNAAPFTLFVPEHSSVASLDLYATVSDYFNGLPEKDSGHTIAVLSAIAPASRCGVSAVHPILSMQCAGHGSIPGSTATFDDGTSIVLSKNGVQLMSTAVGPSTGPVAGQFSLCAPADPVSYELQRFEATPPAAEPSAVGSPVPELMTPPLQVAQPCSSICGTGSGQCLVCVNNNGVTVP
ncbi:MAG: carboxypeptidase-like regulatory domain-containing protein, partial [Candidatus Binataceae bacterium]